MTRHSLLFLVLLCSSLHSTAQSETLTEERLEAIECKLEQQAAVMIDLQTQMNAILKQNLALKQALALQPTISEYKTDEFVYKLHEVTGDSSSGTVTVFMTVTNTTPEDIDRYQWETVKFMDENGVQNKSFNDYEVSLGVNNNAFGLNSLYSDAPTQLTLTLTNVDKNAQYLKILEGKVHKVTKFVNNRYTDFNRSFILRNIPIKWELP